VVNWKKEVEPILVKYREVTTESIPKEVRKDFDLFCRLAPSPYVARGLTFSFKSPQTADFVDMISRLYKQSDVQLRARLLNEVFDRVPALRPIRPEIIGVKEISKYSLKTVREIMTRAVEADPAIVVSSSNLYATLPRTVRTLKMPELGVLLAGAAAPPDPATQRMGETVADTTANYVNFAFFDVTRVVSRALPLHEGLVEHRTYRLVVSMELTPDARFTGKSSTLERPESSTGTVELDVALITESQSLAIVGDPSAVLKWPEAGPSKARDNAIFVIKALAPTAERKPAWVDVYIYHRQNLLFTARLNLAVTEAGHTWSSDLRPISWREVEDADENRTTLFQKFSYVNLIAQRDVNLAVQRGAGDDYTVTAFMGRMELPVRVQMSRAEIESTLLTARRLLDQLRLNPVYVSEGFNRRGDYTGRHLGASFNDRGDEVTGEQGRVVFDEFMRKMAVAGKKFSSDLFKTSSAARLREIIRRNVPEGGLIQVWLEDAARDFLYPWSWLYDGEVDESQDQPPNHDLFWGHRYIIEVMPRFPEQFRFDPPEPEIPADRRLLVKAGVFNFTQIEKQSTFFKEWEKRSGGVLVMDMWDAAARWKEYLPACDCQIIYFFSHGHTSLPASLAGIHVQDAFAGLQRMVQEQEARTGAGDPSAEYYKRLRESLRDQQDNSALSTQTHIKLQRGVLDLDALRRIDPQDPVPLVFLNMCESAQVFPSLSDGLVDVFLRRRARGVIGTEMPMIPHFADLLARRFFDEFFTRSLPDNSVGNILLDLRREYLAKGNPLGFAYTFFGDATARLSQPLTTSPTPQKEISL
jgi:hypothetical protein